MLGKAVEALSALTSLLVAKPSLRNQPKNLTSAMQSHLEAHWGKRPSVLCSSGGSLAPGHPFVAMRAELLQVIVIMPVDMQNSS